VGSVEVMMLPESSPATHSDADAHDTLIDGPRGPLRAGSTYATVQAA
jgi:hypothetical protein